MNRPGPVSWGARPLTAGTVVTALVSQADQIFLLAMIENRVGALHQKAIHGAVAVACGFRLERQHPRALERAAAYPAG